MALDPRDITTRLLRQALDIVFLKHPVRTALGVLVGLALNTFRKALSPLLATVEMLDLSGVSPLELIIVGIVVMHIPTIISFMSSRPKLDEDIEQALRAIELAKRHGLDESDARERYLLVIDRYIARLQSKGSVEGSVREPTAENEDK